MGGGKDERTEHRAFALARHNKHGMLLLRAEKKKKGVHFQLSGGHVDSPEIARLGLEAAMLVAVSREIFEETGIDVRQNLSRLHRLKFPPQVELAIGTRAFFSLELTDADSLGSNGNATPLSGEPGFTLRLSDEHTGFRFERSLDEAAKAVELHSGGKCSVAVRALASGTAAPDLPAPAASGGTSEGCCCSAGIRRLVGS